MTVDGRTRQFAMGVLRDAGLDGADAEIAIEALVEAGLMVGRPFVVPSDKVLYREYMRLAEADIHRRMPVRWVMCRETYASIEKRHAGMVAAVAPEIKWAFSPAEDSPDLADTMTAVPVASCGKLFGIPIRIDPAARAPMWEVPE